MRVLLIIFACVAAVACDEVEDENLVGVVREARASCREAKNNAEYVAGLRKSLRQEPTLPADINGSTEEVCRVSDAIVQGAMARMTDNEREIVANDIKAEAIARAAANAN